MSQLHEDPNTGRWVVSGVEPLPRPQPISAGRLLDDPRAGLPLAHRHSSAPDTGRRLRRRHQILRHSVSPEFAGPPPREHP